jgi:hypothetical protein|nr:hypothetical protein [uncultured Oscillibacter sp.]
MKLHNETTAAPAADLQRPAYVLSDEALLSLSEYTPYSEGDAFLWVIDIGKKVGGFWGIAEDVARAIAADAIHLRSGQARALLAMRAFYFLGVLRGGEAYRSLVAGNDDDEPEFKDLPFEVFSQLFVEDMNDLPEEEFNSILALLGLTVPWAAEDMKGGPEA